MPYEREVDGSVIRPLLSPERQQESIQTALEHPENKDIGEREERPLNVACRGAVRNIRDPADRVCEDILSATVRPANIPVEINTRALPKAARCLE